MYMIELTVLANMHASASIRYFAFLSELTSKLYQKVNTMKTAIWLESEPSTGPPATTKTTLLLSRGLYV